MLASEYDFVWLLHEVDGVVAVLHVMSCARIDGAWYSSLSSPEKRLVPDLLTESIEKPPARLKSIARAPPLMTAICAMSCEAGSEASVPNSGSVTFTPSKL